MKYITTEDRAKSQIAYLAEQMAYGIRYDRSQDWKDTYEAMMAEMQKYFNAIVSDEEYERMIEEAIDKGV